MAVIGSAVLPAVGAASCLELAKVSLVAQRAVVVDAAGGRVLWAHQGNLPGPVASLQKLLTALVIVERGDLDAWVPIQPDDVQCQPVNVGLQQGASYRRRDLLAALLVASANDAAQALARDHAGSMPAFAAVMNARAQALGMTRSVFFNAHGLPHEGQRSTAEDVVRLALAVDRHPLLRQLVSSPYASLAAQGQAHAVPLRNTNRLLHEMPACDGMKTGFTRLSGYCLVASGFHAPIGRRLVVVLNSTAEAVWSDARGLLVASLGLGGTNMEAGHAPC